MLQSRLPFTLATDKVEISPVHQPLLLDGTLESAAATAYWSDGVVLSWRWSPVNEEYFQALRDELAQVAHELNADGIEQVVYRAGAASAVAASADYWLGQNRARALGDCG